MARKRSSSKGSAGAAIGELGLIRPTTPAPPVPGPDPEDKQLGREEDLTDGIHASSGIHAFDALIKSNGSAAAGDAEIPDSEPEEALTPEAGEGEDNARLEGGLRPHPPLASASKRRRRRPETTRRAELILPDDLLVRARAIGRPHLTEGQRSLGARFVLQAYVRAVDELVDTVNVKGITADDEGEMVERVKSALAERLLGTDETDEQEASAA